MRLPIGTFCWFWNSIGQIKLLLWGHWHASATLHILLATQHIMLAILCIMSKIYLLLRPNNTTKPPKYTCHKLYLFFPNVQWQPCFDYFQSKTIWLLWNLRNSMSKMSSLTLMTPNTCDNHGQSDKQFINSVCLSSHVTVNFNHLVIIHSS